MRPGEAFADVVFGEDFVGELGAGFEGEGFGEDERVVAIEEDGFDLCGVSGGVVLLDLAVAVHTGGMIAV